MEAVQKFDMTALARWASDKGLSGEFCTVLLTQQLTGAHAADLLQSGELVDVLAGSGADKDEAINFAKMIAGTVSPFVFFFFSNLLSVPLFSFSAEALPQIHQRFLL